MTPTQDTMSEHGSLERLRSGAIHAKRSQTYLNGTGERDTARHGEISRPKRQGDKWNAGSENSVKRSQRSENGISVFSRSSAGRSSAPPFRSFFSFIPLSPLSLLSAAFRLYYILTYIPAGGEVRKVWKVRKVRSLG